VLDVGGGVFAVLLLNIYLLTYWLRFYKWKGVLLSNSMLLQ